MATSRDRFEAWASLMLSDHGVLRLFYRNRHQVTPTLWRSAQPSPADIGWARRAGIRTVLSLRGDGFGGDLLEREACERQGLNFERIVMWSRAAPPKASLREAIERFPKLERPVLLHCKSGADRAGLAAAIYLIAVDGAPVSVARRQLSPRFGHIRSGRTGILDAFLDAFERDTQGSETDFAAWVDTAYDPAALTQGFRSSRAADALLTVLRRE
ncbi:MAG: tyrosine-protein phosphatase [Pseudomonadota bacterium]